MDENLVILWEYYKAMETAQHKGYVPPFEKKNFSMYMEQIAAGALRALYQIALQRNAALRWERVLSLVGTEQVIRQALESAIGCYLVDLDRKDFDFSPAASLNDAGAERVKVPGLFSQEMETALITALLVKTQLAYMAHLEQTQQRSYGFAWQTFLAELETDAQMRRAVLDAFVRGIETADLTAVWLSEEMQQLSSMQQTLALLGAC